MKKKKKLLTNEDYFIQGLSCAAHYLIKHCDEPGLALNLLRDSGYDEADLREAGTDEQEVSEIFKELKP